MAYVGNGSSGGPAAGILGAASATCAWYVAFALPGWSRGRTTGFGPVSGGSNPPPGARMSAGCFDLRLYERFRMRSETRKVARQGSDGILRVSGG